MKDAYIFKYGMQMRHISPLQLTIQAAASKHLLLLIVDSLICFVERMPVMYSMLAFMMLISRLVTRYPSWANYGVMAIRFLQCDTSNARRHKGPSRKIRIKLAIIFMNLRSKVASREPSYTTRSLPYQ